MRFLLGPACLLAQATRAEAAMPGVVIMRPAVGEVVTAGDSLPVQWVYAEGDEWPESIVGADVPQWGEKHVQIALYYAVGEAYREETGQNFSLISNDILFEDREFLWSIPRDTNVGEEEDTRLRFNFYIERTVDGGLSWKQVDGPRFSIQQPPETSDQDDGSNSTVEATPTGIDADEIGLQAAEIGAIVGGVAGVVIFAAAVLLYLSIQKKRRVERHAREEMEEQEAKPKELDGGLRPELEPCSVATEIGDGPVRLATLETKPAINSVAVELEAGPVSRSMDKEAEKKEMEV